MPSRTKDYYATLGVDKGASAEEIKKAFRRKARELHPDVNSASDAEERFKEVNEAYDVLSDPPRRDQYDRFGTVGGGPSGPGGYQYSDLGDLFGGGINMEDVFSAFFGGVGASRGGVRLEGRDMAMQIAVTLADAAKGMTKDVVIDRLATCDVCGGSGSTGESKVVTCSDCGGRGQRVTQRQTFIGTMQTVTPCERCGASGHVIEHPCEECEGSGRVPDRQHVTIEIPAGIRDGQQIRLRGLGEAGIRSAAAGDLLVTVRVLPHEYLHREGDDLHCRATVSMTQAALGAKITVAGVLEDVELDVPAGAQHGDTIRARSKGMPRVGGGGSRGDMIVHLSVTVPRKLNKKQRELLEALAAESGEEHAEHRSPLDKLKDWLGG